MLADFFVPKMMDLVRLLVVGAMAYISLVLLLRITGKRALAKMNAFDWVVTVAMGSTLATTLLAKDVAYLEGALAFGLLLGLQYLVSWLSVRSRQFRKLIKARPALLFYKGEFLDEALTKERVAREEVLQAMRSQGQADLSGIHAVVLETDGTFSVITGSEGETSTMGNVAERE